MSEVLTIRRGKTFKRDGQTFAATTDAAIEVEQVENADKAETRLLKAICDDPKHRPRRVTLRGCDEFKLAYPELVRPSDDLRVETPRGYTGDTCYRCLCAGAANPYVRLAESERAKLDLGIDGYATAVANEPISVITTMLEESV